MDIRNIQNMTEKKKYDVIKFNSIYDEPDFKIKRGKDWVDFGAKNDCPEYILSLLDQSATHSGIIKGKIDFIIGNGLVVPTGNTKAEAFFANVPSNEEASVLMPTNLNVIMQKFVRDLVVFGAGAFNIRWRRDRKGISDISYVDVVKYRVDSDNEGGWISDDWKQLRKEPFIPKFHPAFTLDKGVDGSQLFYVQEPSARNQIYALPSYWSAREYIETDQELITFDLNRLRNQFFASTIISFPDTPTPEEQDRLYDQLKNFYGGTSNSGKAAILFGVGENGMKFDKFEAARSPEDFELIQSNVDKKIKVAHRVTGRGEIFGLSTGDGTTFGSKDDLKNEFEAFNKLVVRPTQKFVCDVFNQIAAAGGVEWTFEFDPFVLFEDDVQQNNSNTTDQNGVQ